MRDDAREVLNRVARACRIDASSSRMKALRRVEAKTTKLREPAFRDESTRIGVAKRADAVNDLRVPAAFRDCLSGAAWPPTSGAGDPVLDQ